MSLYTALSPCSRILSSLRVSLALQKCQTRWQYVKYGKTADLKSTNFAVVGIGFLNLIITSTLWLTLLHASLMCSLKFNLLSIVTPKIFNESDVLIILPFMVKLVLCSAWLYNYFLKWKFKDSKILEIIIQILSKDFWPESFSMTWSTYEIIHICTAVVDESEEWSSQ